MIAFTSGTVVWAGTDVVSFGASAFWDCGTSGLATCSVGLVASVASGLAFATGSSGLLSALNPSEDGGYERKYSNYALIFTYKCSILPLWKQPKW